MIWKTVFVVLAVGVLVDSMYDEMCRSNGRGDIGDEMEKKLKEAFQCMAKVMDMEAVKQDFLESLSTSSFTSAVKKYCPKASKVKACIKGVYSEPDPCLPQFVLSNVITMHNATKIALDFICYNDGESINSFAADGGFQCLKDKTEDFGECGATITDAPSDNSPNSHEIHCRILGEVENCVTTTLESCSTSAAANVAKPFFAIARKAHSCA